MTLMWQAHYYLAVAKTRELEAEADRKRRWHLQDSWNDRPTAGVRTPSRLRVGTARVVALVSRGTARIALRLDGRVCVEAGLE